MTDSLKKQTGSPGLVAPHLRPSPGAFPLRSLESRAAARALAEAKRRRNRVNPELAAAIADPLVWLQHYTRTRDSHWQEAGATSAYRPFPDKPHFRPLLEIIRSESVVFVEKSRDMMLSWLCVGYFTHACMTTESIEVLFQSQTEEKAAELVEYAKCLYERQHGELKAAYPLAEGSSQQSSLELSFANGSRIIGIPHGADKVRSYHPWALLMDEAAFMPEAGEAYDEAVSACQKIVVVSSAGPGWFELVCESAT
jgi:hypothetical protein